MISENENGKRTINHCVRVRSVSTDEGFTLIDNWYFTGTEVFRLRDSLAIVRDRVKGFFKIDRSPTARQFMLAHAASTSFSSSTSGCNCSPNTWYAFPNPPFWAKGV